MTEQQVAGLVPVFPRVLCFTIPQPLGSLERGAWSLERGACGHVWSVWSTWKASKLREAWLNGYVFSSSLIFVNVLSLRNLNASQDSTGHGGANEVEVAHG